MERNLKMRGQRNNNPLNIEYSKRNKWVGKISDPKLKTDERFEEFDTMENGVRAAIKLVQSYIKRGFNTVPDIIRRWCPDNTAEGYISFVMNSIRKVYPDFESDSILEWHNAAHIGEMIKAMARMESQYTITDAMFLEAWKSAHDKAYTRRKQQGEA